MTEARYLSAKQVAEILAIPERTARSLMRSKMVHVYVGKHLRVSPQALSAYTKTQEQQPCEALESRGPEPTTSNGASRIRLTQPRRRRANLA
jgi:hypothetical protein